MLVICNLIFVSLFTVHFYYVIFCTSLAYNVLGDYAGAKIYSIQLIGRLEFWLKTNSNRIVPVSRENVMQCENHGPGGE